MLVLSRKRDEQIVINENIIITVVDIRGDKVRLGVHAPKDVVVHRMEIYEKIQKQKESTRLHLEPSAGAGAGRPPIAEACQGPDPEGES